MTTRRGFFAGAVGLISGLLTRRTTGRSDVSARSIDPDQWIFELDQKMRRKIDVPISMNVKTTSTLEEVASLAGRDGLVKREFKTGGKLWYQCHDDFPCSDPTSLTFFTPVTVVRHDYCSCFDRRPVLYLSSLLISDGKSADENLCAIADLLRSHTLYPNTHRLFVNSREVGTVERWDVDRALIVAPCGAPYLGSCDLHPCEGAKITTVVQWRPIA